MLRLNRMSPAAGAVRLSRLLSAGEVAPLFMSPAPAPVAFRLEVSRGTICNDTGWEYVEPAEPLVTVDLAPHQLAELLSGLNLERYTPATIRAVQGEPIPYASPNDPLDWLEDDPHEEAATALSFLRAAKERLEASRGAGPLDAPDQERLLREIGAATDYLQRVPATAERQERRMRQTIERLLVDLEAERQARLSDGL